MAQLAGYKSRDVPTGRLYINRNIILRITAATLLLAAMLLSCSAPHSNPLDPQNPDYQYILLSGLVQTISLPVQAVPNTTIKWQTAAGSELSSSDQQGRFKLQLASADAGWLFFSHPDFHPDSMAVSRPVNKSVEVDIYLNSLPQLDTLAVYSSVLNRLPALQKEQLIVEAQVSDRDNDIDSVWVTLSGQIKRYFLPYNSTKKSFRQEFSILDLDIIQLEELVGKSFSIGVSDIFSHYSTVGSAQLVRVIHPEVVCISPSENIISGPTPELVWETFQPGFEFIYQVQIYTNEVAPLLVWEQNGLTMDRTSCIVGNALSTGNYFWVIWAIDSFGDRTRSKPATFQVL
jgi:hypothetical protein